MKIWKVSPFVINSLHKVGVKREADWPKPNSGTNQIANLRTQDGKMHIDFCHDAYNGPQESIMHEVALALTPELEEAVNRLAKNDPGKAIAFALRQVKLELDLRAGNVCGEEELMGGVIRRGIMVEAVPQTDLGNVSAKSAKLPISGTSLKGFLYEILTWVTEKPRETSIYRTRDDIFSNNYRMSEYLRDPDAIATLFVFIREIANNLRA
jgi:hypothetical protein